VIIDPFLFVIFDGFILYAACFRSF